MVRKIDAVRSSEDLALALNDWVGVAADYDTTRFDGVC
jgi:hypothetical protein